MRYSQFFMRAHIENMASLAGIVPSGGFEAIEA
jgi:hypothetical protein